MRKIGKISKIKYFLTKKKLSLICPGECGHKLTLLKTLLNVITKNVYIQNKNIVFQL